MYERRKSHVENDRPTPLSFPLVIIAQRYAVDLETFRPRRAERLSIARSSTLITVRMQGRNASAPRSRVAANPLRVTTSRRAAKPRAVSVRRRQIQTKTDYTWSTKTGLPSGSTNMKLAGPVLLLSASFVSLSPATGGGAGARARR